MSGPLRLALRTASIVVLCVVALVLESIGRRLERAGTSPFPLLPAPAFRYFPTGGLDLDDAKLPLVYTLERGETLETVFRRFGLAPREALDAAGAASQHLDPKKLRAGASYAAYFARGHALTGFAFAIPDQGRVHVQLRDGQWHSSFETYRRSVRTVAVTGELSGGLEASLKEAGAEPALAYRMEEVLRWDLDFNRDLRLGDRFYALYESVSLEGQGGRVGEIAGLIYDNRGRRLEAYRYEGGFYDGDGRPLRKQFLRSPLPYSSRVTSRFSHRRFHPVLKIHRPHLGVDYGAPIGTPVRVTATGVVDFSGWDRGGGKTVKVRHANGYLTAYLHLSRFAPKVRRGLAVEQGDVIGYVGSTGISTGPHLDYRVRHRGRWIDPLSLKNEPAPPIPSDERFAFFATRDAVRRRLLDTPTAPELALAVLEPDTAGPPTAGPPAAGR